MSQMRKLEDETALRGLMAERLSRKGFYDLVWSESLKTGFTLLSIDADRRKEFYLFRFDQVLPHTDGRAFSMSCTFSALCATIS
jgi:hypothetical protein